MSNETDDLVTKLQAALDRHDIAAAVRFTVELRARGVDVLPALLKALNAGPAGAGESEAACRGANQAMLDALLLAQLNPGDGPARYVFNAALVRLREIERLRRPSGVLTAAAIDAEKLGTDALQSALRELAGARGRVRFAGAEFVMAARFYAQGLRIRVLAVLWRLWERYRC